MLSQLVLGFLEEYRKKKQFTDLFGQYVPPELVKKMAEDPERYSMAGRRLQMTVLVLRREGLYIDLRATSPV